MNQDRFQMLQWLVDGGLIAWEMTGNAWINGPNTLGLSIHEICEQARVKMKVYVSKVESNNLHRSSVNNFRSSRMNNSDTDSDESEGSKCLDALNEAVLHAPAKPLTVENIKNVFCCIRPPGHHAGRYGSTRGCTQNGFCLLNNIIIGAYYARIKYGHRKFAVIDIDAHFGNGTAEILEGDPHAFYASIHLQSESPTNPFFPSSPCCLLGEDCDEPNRVFVNVFPSEVPRALIVFARNRLRGREGFREAFITRVIPRLKAFQPDFIFISSGFDGSSTDPVGGQLGLLPQDFHAMVQELRVCAENMCGGRLVSVLEGGYDVSSRTNGLAVAAEAHVKALMCLPL